MGVVQRDDSIRLLDRLLIDLLAGGLGFRDEWDGNEVSAQRFRHSLLEVGQKREGRIAPEAARDVLRKVFPAFRVGPPEVSLKLKVAYWRRVRHMHY